jgi:hypothetical protein
MHVQHLLQRIDVAKAWLARLSDFAVRRTLAPSLMSLAYFSTLGGAAYLLAWLVYATFRIATWLGLLHLFVIAPLALFATAVLARVFLELTQAVLEMHDTVLEIHGNVGELGELPRRVRSWPALQKLAELGARGGFLGPAPAPSVRKPGG